MTTTAQDAFEKWWSVTMKEIFDRRGIKNPDRVLESWCKAAYLAGREQGLQEASEVVEKHRYAKWTSMVAVDATKDAILRLKG